jgi:hypothetical protein
MTLVEYQPQAPKFGLWKIIVGVVLVLVLLLGYMLTTTSKPQPVGETDGIYLR